MWVLLAAVWLALTGPLGPDLPPLEIEYLGGTAVQPGGVDGLKPVSPGDAVAVLFKGAFDFGGTATLTAALDAAPHARLVVFNSPGGRPMVADGIAQVIRARHLDTTVETYCASACTIAYLAGTVRTAERRARFGFHLGTGPVFADMAATIVIQLERKWFLRGGASLSFAERALHAPNPDPYFAPLDELMAAGYIHRVVDASPMLLPPAHGLLKAVAGVERLTWESLANAEVSTRRRGGAVAARAEAIAEQRASLVVDRWFSRTSDVAAMALIDAQLAALDVLLASDGRSCMHWLIGRDDQDLSFAELPHGLQHALRAAQEDVLEEANGYPVPSPVDDGALAAADAAVRRDVAAAFGPRALAVAASAEHGFDDPGRSCGARIGYLRGLRGRPEGARLVRWALGAG